MQTARQLSLDSVLGVGRPKRKPMPIAFRLGEEWADLWERLKEQEGVGATELFKLQMKTFAILKSVDDSGKPLKITVHLPTGEDIDFRELLKISDADEAA